MTDIAYIALGSNLGDRFYYLRQAIEELEKYPQLTVLRKSRIYETESIEGGGEGDFLNAVICLKTSFAPLELLRATQRIESSLGRPLPPRHGPRCIDIDILFFEQQNSTDPELILPHPRMYRRAFVLAPLLDVLENGAINTTLLNW